MRIIRGVLSAMESYLCQTTRAQMLTATRTFLVLACTNSSFRPRVLTIMDKSAAIGALGREAYFTNEIFHHQQVCRI